MTDLASVPTTMHDLADAEPFSSDVYDAAPEHPGTLTRVARVAVLSIAVLGAAVAIIWLGSATVEWIRDGLTWISESMLILLGELRGARWALGR